MFAQRITVKIKADGVLKPLENAKCFDGEFHIGSEVCMTPKIHCQSIMQIKSVGGR